MNRSVRQLDSSVTAGRHVRLIVFTLVSAEGTDAAPEVPDFHNSFTEGFNWLEKQGFEVVEHMFTDASTIRDDIQSFKDRIPTYDIPSDGLVLAFAKAKIVLLRKDFKGLESEYKIYAEPGDLI